MGKSGCKFTLSIISAVVAVLLLASLVSAEVNVKADKDVYNFGDEIVVNYDFLRDQDFSGLVKLSLSCSNFDLEFYTLPTNLFAGQKQEVSVPPLSIASAMLGKCYVAANATSYDRLLNESSTSNFFNVTNLLSVDVEVDKDLYLPSGSVEVSGLVGKSHMLPANVVMAFQGTNYMASVANNSFAYSIRLPKNIKSGLHGIELFINDSYGNSGSASGEFEVESVPTRIVNALSSQNIRPAQPFSVLVSVYDQADDRVKSDADVTVTDSVGSVVLSALNRTFVNITLIFPQGQKPGTYALVSSASGLTATSQLVVEEVEEAAVSFDNKTVVLKNTGNVNYAKKFNITLSGQKSYVIEHDVEIAPGEVFTVDLTNTVSEDSYDISFPTVADAPVVEDVHLEDNRPLIKKTSDFLGITGRAVKLTGTGTGKVQAKFAPLLLFVIIAVLAFYFVKNRGKGGKDYRDGSSNKGSSTPQFREERNAQSGSPRFAPLSTLSGDGSGDKAATQAQPAQSREEAVEARIRQIIEEKRRQQLTREPQKPASLREDPQAQKFVRDMMKDKPFR
ncbi:hypothetical protein HYV85_04595 [Candidatus Woesearchaeota archaeon]|nr:hypothetical protein [Candidatus Woesearchaeota archaeon]